MERTVRGDLLETLRKRHVGSQQQLADRLGVRREQVSRWETGAATPTIVNLHKIARELGVAVDAFSAP